MHAKAFVGGKVQAFAAALRGKLKCDARRADPRRLFKTPFRCAKGIIKTVTEDNADYIFAFGKPPA